MNKTQMQKFGSIARTEGVAWVYVAYITIGGSYAM